MTARSQIWIVSRREFIERSRSKVFRIALVALSALVIGGMFVISLLVGDSESIPVAVGGNSPPGLVDDVKAASNAAGADIVVIEYSTKGEAVDAVEAGDADAALTDGDTIVSMSSPSGTVTSVLSSAARVAVRRQVAADLGLSSGEVESIVSPVQVNVIQLEPEESSDPSNEARAVASFMSALVLLTTIMMFGQFVAVGIVEEKQNRIVEVILSRVTSSSLLIGKVLGIGALGLVQVAALGAAAVIGLMVVPLPDLGGLDLTSVGVTAVAWLVFWFVLGYLTYSFMYATVGATISRQEDMQSVAFIPAIAIMPAYLLMVFSIEGGVNALVRIASFVPLWSPIVMPFRINVGDAQLWEVAVAVLLIVLTIAVLVQVGSRVYRGAALRTGARVSLRDAWRSGSDLPEAG